MYIRFGDLANIFRQGCVNGVFLIVGCGTEDTPGLAQPLKYDHCYTGRKCVVCRILG